MPSSEAFPKQFYLDGKSKIIAAWFNKILAVETNTATVNIKADKDFGRGLI